MKGIEDKILKLQSISAKLEPSEADRDLLMDKVHQYSNAFLNELEDLPTFVGEKETQGVFKIDGEKKSINEILSLFEKEVVSKGIKPASGGHVGYIPGGGIYTSSIADYLADVTNIYSGVYFASPGGVAMEHELINWLKSIFGFPDSAIGNLASGGSIANLIALTAARDKYKIKSEVIPKSVIYLSPQVHHCIYKALRIIGLEDVVVRHLALDEKSRIKTDHLKSLIEQDKKDGLNPFLVIASAGTTDTGAIDPLEEIARITKENALWFHVDAAYGGFFILVEEMKERFKGIELADSLVIDPHKGLFLPYGLGVVLIKDREAVFHSHHYTANYMQDTKNDNQPLSPADVSPELTKPFRGLRMWIPIQLHGIEPFVACLEEKLLLTSYFREKLSKNGFELGPEPDLSVSYFWYPSKDMDENAFNKELMKYIHQDGDVFLSSTLINGKFVIRMAILSFRTKLTTIDKAIAMVEKAKLKILNNIK